MTKPHAEIGVAFLGVGRMGETHLRNLATISGVRVRVVADPNLEAAEHGREISGADRAIVSTEEAILDPAVDAVIIVTPTDTHAGLIETAVLAGKALFSEKPIALDLAETKRVVDLIQQKDGTVQLGFMRRFDPGYAEAKKRIDQGELGRIETFRALSRDTYPPPLKFLLQSGGSFLDMAVSKLQLSPFFAWGGFERCAPGAVFVWC